MSRFVARVEEQGDRVLISWTEDALTGEIADGAPFVFLEGPLCSLPSCFRYGPHYVGECGCVASAIGRARADGELVELCDRKVARARSGA